MTTSAPERLPERTRTARVRTVAKRLVTRQEAAESLSMSVDSFERFVQPHLALVRQGRMRLVPTKELDRWIDEHMELI